MSSKNNLYHTVIKNGFDVGSGAFAVIDNKIKMVLNEYGLYESKPNNRFGIEVFENPKLSKVSCMSDISDNEDIIGKELFAKVKDIKHSSILGYYSDLYAGHVIEGDFRKNASSGGLTTWLFKELLSKGYIDGVIHVKEATGSNGILFEYGISRSVEEICAGSKTRYYPVEFSKVIREVKKTPGKFAIVGIPSLIMELRLLAKQDPIVRDKIKYTVGLICGHQKSTKYAESLAWQRGIAPGNLKSIDFRVKQNNKPANNYATKMVGIVNKKTKAILIENSDLYGSNWGHGFFKAKFSDYTDDAMNETADVTLGDAWLPEYAQDSLGNNVVIARNATIAKILKDGIDKNKIKLDVISVDTMIKSQLGLIHHTRDELPYRLYKLESKGLWFPKKRVLPSKKITSLRKNVQDIRLLISNQSHIHYKTAVDINNWQHLKDSTKVYVTRYNYTYKMIKLRSMGPVLVAKKATKKLVSIIKI